MGLLNGKVITITGASRGIGAAAAALFAREGAALVLAARGLEALEGLAANLRAGGADVIAVGADVSTTDGVTAVVDAAIRRHDRLDGAFLNAGISAAGAPKLVELAEDAWDDVHALTLRGVWLSLRAHIPHLVAAGGGSIAITGSVAGSVAGIGDGAYQAAKQGVVALARAAAQEYAPDGVRVNVVVPGAVLTEGVLATFAEFPQLKKAFEEHTPLGRGGSPAEIAEAAAWLLSDRSSFVTGTALPVDGGLTASRL